MESVPILELKEVFRQRWKYSTNYTAGALRLVSVKNLLDKRSTSIVLNEFKNVNWDSEKPKFCAISHVWKPSAEVRRISNRIHRPLEIEVGSERPHTINWHGLVQAARAAEHFGCDYMWLDFLCLHQLSKTDKALQIKNMGNIYRHAQAVLVMPGGVSAAQSQAKDASWINRAWTLQEATLNPNTYVLLDWPRGYSITIEGVTNAEFKSLGNIAIIRLRGLLEAHLSPDETYYTVDGEEIEGLVLEDIKCFGKDRTAMMELWAVLAAGDDQNLLQSSVWRCMYMRTSTKPQDMVFSILHLLGVDMVVDYDRTVDDLIFELAAKTASRPMWLDIGSGMPLLPRSGLLPSFPTFVANSIPHYRIGENTQPVSSFIHSQNYISNVDMTVWGEPGLDGHWICGQILRVEGWEYGEPDTRAELLDTYFPGSDDSDSSDSEGDSEPRRTTLVHLSASNGTVIVECATGLSLGTHVVIIGEKTTYNFLGFQEMETIMSIGAPVIFLDKSDGIWRKCGTGTLAKYLTNTERKHLRVGGHPGAEILPCTCEGYLRSSELKTLETYSRQNEFGYLFPAEEADEQEEDDEQKADGEEQDEWEDDDEFQEEDVCATKEHPDSCELSGPTDFPMSLTRFCFQPGLPLVLLVVLGNALNVDISTR